jgi:hypothetical protein
MRYLALIAAVTPTFAVAAPADDLLVGTFSNEEQVYFDKETKRTPPPLTTLRITKVNPGYKLENIDAFGRPLASAKTLIPGKNNSFLALNDGRCIRTFKQFKTSLVQLHKSGDCNESLNLSLINVNGITISDENGTATELRRSRPATCWGSILREGKKPDGSPDWYFISGLKLHDQGGRVAFGGGDTGAQQVTLRMRNVVWPKGNNSRPSLVLYVHKPEKPDSAESYVWGDPGAVRLGINLRWVQASCSMDGLDTPAVVKSETTKG